jgi:hypothetical protein
LFYAANVIVVVMRQQNGFRLPAVFFDGGQNRRGFAGIDDDAAAVISLRTQM